MLAALLTLAATLAVGISPASGQPPVPGSPAVIDGPSNAILRPAGLGVSIARDGTGGLVYMKSVGGVAHVFVSRLAGGSFGPPAQVDSGLTSPSSQPVIAAGNGGLLLVAFINAGQLYVVDGNAGQFAAPLRLAAGGFNPAISITNFGKAYLAFTVADGGGKDVRAAYYDAGSWALEAAPLNSGGPDDAGTGTGRPAVAAAGDGIGIVVWGENGHIYSRRVWGTGPSIVEEQADGPPPGCTESSAGDPVVGSGGDSSYASVAFDESVTCGGQKQSRVLVNRLQGSVYDGIAEADGIPPASTDGAEDPQIAVGEYGSGFLTTARTASGNAVAADLGANEVFGGTVTQVNSLPATSSPYPVPAVAGYHAMLIAWQQQPGASPGGDIRVRFAPDGVTLGPESVLSSPAQGPVDAADGLAAAGDIFGDAAIVWLQGPPGATEVMVGQLYEPPGGFSPVSTLAYAKTAQPVLAWRGPSGWGPMKYSLSIDRTQAGQTYATSATVPAPLANGPHTWQVTASNPAGQQSRSRAATVFVDTVAPVAGLSVPRRTTLGRKVRAVVKRRDHPPAGERAADASGIATVLIRWGDGRVSHLALRARSLTHRYRRRGRYRIVLVVTDRAGNVTRVVRFVKVLGRTGH